MPSTINEQYNGNVAEQAKSYGYDAAGNKLWQQVRNAAGEEVVTTDYVGAFEYSNSTLSLVHHGEGRICFPGNATAGAYHFDLRDHLGNVRVSFSPTPIINRQVATMEADPATAYYEESFFTNMDTRRKFAAYNTTPANDQSTDPQYVAQYVAHLNAYADTITGPARSLAVRQGDKVRLQVQARYEQLGSETTATGTEGVVAAIVSAFGASAGVEGTASYQALNEALAGSVLLANEGDDVPHAYLNYLLFDENFALKAEGMTEVTQAGAVTATTPNAVETLLIPEIVIPENGYLYTYLSNESNWNVSVYFDDFVVEHETHLVQVNDYYPFGARHDQGSFVADHAKYGYQGKELTADLGLNLLDFHARQYDPLLGRFSQVDPKSGAFFAISPYTGMGNSPLNYIDPDGEFLLPLLFFTDIGYDIQKRFSPIALHIDLNLGTHQRGVGADVSVGIPKAFPISYRVNGGASYYWKNYDITPGWETRYGSEIGLGGYFSVGGTHYNSPGTQFDQTTNNVMLGIPGFNVKYENDWFFDLNVPLVPNADGGDRYRTAAAQIQAGYLKIGINLFTGDPGLDGDTRERDIINGRETYVFNPRTRTDPDEFRAGVGYIGIGPLRFGSDSENRRHKIQNELIHDNLTPPSPYFRVLDRRTRWFFQIGGRGGRLW